MALAASPLVGPARASRRCGRRPVVAGHVTPAAPSVTWVAMSSSSDRRATSRRPRRLSPSRRVRREEVEAGLGGGACQVEAKIGVGQGDGEAGEEALVDLGLAGADEATQLLGAVARLLARAPLTNGHERGEIVAGDEAG